MKTKLKNKNVIINYFNSADLEDLLSGDVIININCWIRIERVIVYNFESNDKEVQWGLFYENEITPIATFRSRSSALLYRHQLMK